MIDANAFFLMLLCILGSILVVVLIVLVVKLIFTVDRVNKLLDDVEGKLSKTDNLFSFVDLVGNNLTVLSDKIVEVLTNLIKKLFDKNGKGEIENGEK